MYHKSYISTLFLLSTISIYLFTTLASDADPMHDFCIPNPKFGHINKNSSKVNISPCKISIEVEPDDFVFSSIKSTSSIFSEIGLNAISVTPENFPALHTLGMSFVHVQLKIGGINPPHFHPRATELAYVLKGKVYSGFVDSTNRVFAKVIEEGEVMVFPRGLVHFMMNVGKTNAVIFGSFNSEIPGVQKIPNTIFGSGINDELLEKAFGLSLREIVMIRKRFLPRRQGIVKTGEDN